MLCVEHDRWAIIQSQLVSQDDIMCAVSWVAEPIGRIEVLKYPKESSITMTSAATRFRSQNSRKSKFNGLVLSDYATRNKIVVFCGLVSSKSYKHSTVGIPYD